MLAGFARFLVCTIGRCFQPAPYKTFRTFLYMRVILDVKVQRLQAFLPQKYFGPCLYNQIAAVFIPNFFPGIGRLLAFYEHFLPIVFGYLKTKYITIPLKKSSQPAELLWDMRHHWGAEKCADMLQKLSGFYLKVAQVFATKQDFLPKQYIRKLAFVFESCEPVSPTEVRRIIDSNMSSSIRKQLSNVDYSPIASATIAQVHRGTMVGVEGDIVLKIKRPGSENLMKLDMSNMLLVSKILDSLNIRLPFDHISVLLEYQNEIPKEFDFHRERTMMDLLGTSIRSKFECINVPSSLPTASSNDIIAMTFMEGCSLSNFLSQESRIELGKTTLTAFAHSLLEVYAYQIFELGIFQSDPHPGNILIGRDGSLTLLDFGQVKVLSSSTRIALAQLVVALARDSPYAGELLTELGIKVDNAHRHLKSTVAYILFDTRMDLPEARMNPFDDELPLEIRQMKLSRIPQETFMLVRVVALLRGILSSLNLDIHARIFWAPYAEAFLRINKIRVTQEPKRTAEQRNPHEQMTRIADWMTARELPSTTKHLTPFALANIWSIEDLAALFSSKDTKKMEKVLKFFSCEERSKIQQNLIRSSADASCTKLV